MKKKKPTHLTDEEVAVAVVVVGKSEANKKTTKNDAAERMLCRKGSRNGVVSGSVPVYLNVYDLTPINGYAYWFGLGVYHSGVQGSLLFFFLRTHFRSTIYKIKNDDGYL